jgi:site-specific DNA-cytosine methylase
LAYHCEKMWCEYSREDERVRHWESGISCTTDGVPDRAHRLRALGNAVVPQCAQVVGEFIKQVIDNGDINATRTIG